jgi:hypothetical protein
MNRRSHMPSQVGVMHSPGYGAMHWIRPMRRRGNLVQAALVAAGAALVLLAFIGAFTH